MEETVDLIAPVIGPIIAGIALTALTVGWSALKRYVLKTPNKWDDAILRPIDAIVGVALRKYAASQNNDPKHDTDDPPL